MTTSGGPLYLPAPAGAKPKRTVTTTNGGKTFAGKVTGGTGAFKGATGTITAKALNKAGTRHAVTITYSG